MDWVRRGNGERGRGEGEKEKSTTERGGRKEIEVKERGEIK